MWTSNAPKEILTSEMSYRAWVHRSSRSRSSCRRGSWARPWGRPKTRWRSAATCASRCFPRRARRPPRPSRCKWTRTFTTGLDNPHLYVKILTAAFTDSSTLELRKMKSCRYFSSVNKEGFFHNVHVLMKLQSLMADSYSFVCKPI